MKFYSSLSPNSKSKELSKRNRMGPFTRSMNSIRFSLPKNYLKSRPTSWFGLTIALRKASRSMERYNFPSKPQFLFSYFPQSSLRLGFKKMLNFSKTQLQTSSLSRIWPEKRVISGTRLQASKDTDKSWNTMRILLFSSTSETKPQP